MNRHLKPIDQASLLASHAVSYATAYLRGEHSAVQLADDAHGLFLDMLAISAPEANRFLAPVKLLAIAMLHTSRYGLSDARLARWHDAMGSLVELVQQESRALRSDLSTLEGTQ